MPHGANRGPSPLIQCSWLVTAPVRIPQRNIEDVSCSGRKLRAKTATMHRPTSSRHGPQLDTLSCSPWWLDFQPSSLSSTPIILFLKNLAPENVSQGELAAVSQPGSSPFRGTSQLLHDPAITRQPTFISSRSPYGISFVRLAPRSALASLSLLQAKTVLQNYYRVRDWLSHSRTINGGASRNDCRLKVRYCSFSRDRNPPACHRLAGGGGVER